MALQTIDATAAVGGQTYAQASVDTDGTILTGPPACAAIYLRLTAAGAFSVGGAGADEVPIDADTWTLVWQQSPGVASTPSVFAKPSTGTATVYARVV